MIYYNKQHIISDDIKSVIKSLKADKITKGSFKNAFENELKKYFQCKYCLVVSSGTAAQIALAKAMELKQKDHILMQPLTFVSGSNSIELVGANSVFVDIDKETLSVDLKKLETKLKILKKKKKKVKAIMITDYAGRPSNWVSLKKLSKKFNCKLINDNCHALGASYKKSKSYATKYADFVIQSFHAVKNITTGEGGALLTNDKKIFLKAKAFAEHGFEIGKNIKDPWDYKLSHIGYNFRLSDINCALGLSQLKRIKKIVEKRAKIAKLYENFFSRFSFFKTIQNKNESTSAHHIFPLSIDFKKLKVNPRDFYFNLKSKYNIQLQKHYTPIYRFKYYKKKYKINIKEFNNTENFFNNSFSLPLYNELQPKQIRYVCRSILKALNVNKNKF